MKITKGYLTRLRACQEGIDLFNSVFPSGADVTVQNIEKAVERGLPFLWFSYQVLTPKKYEELKNKWLSAHGPRGLVELYTKDEMVALYAKYLIPAARRHDRKRLAKRKRAGAKQ